MENIRSIMRYLKLIIGIIIFLPCCFMAVLFACFGSVELWDDICNPFINWIGDR